jgi:molybdate transport system regulatory protein
MMKPRFNLWLERDGEVVLSAWRVQLLEAVEVSGSITGAAESMGVPYRRAWERLQEMEARVGEPIITTEVGGAGGGGANLTVLGRDLIARFHRFADGFDEEVMKRFVRAFEPGERDEE